MIIILCNNPSKKLGWNTAKRCLYNYRVSKQDLIFKGVYDKGLYQQQSQQLDYDYELSTIKT